MMLVKLSLSNLTYNLRRTILQVLLIAVALSSLILYKGYVDYSKDGMALGFIENSGNLQISSATVGENLNGEDIDFINSVLNQYGDDVVDKIEPVLSFKGLIKNGKESTIFWGLSFDSPEQQFGVTEGCPVFPESKDIVIGATLAKELNIKFDSPVTLIFQNGDETLEADFNVSGITETGIPENDSGIVIASRDTVQNVIGKSNSASFIQLFLRNDKNTFDIKEKLINDLGSNYVVKDWVELNPYYNQVNNMNKVQYLGVSLILCILILISLTHSLATSFNERLYEFGTLEAIGLNKLKIIILVILEVIFLAILGIGTGIGFAEGLNKVLTMSKIEFIPPGYSSGAYLSFYFTSRTIINCSLFVFITCLISMIGPICNVCRNTVVRLMQHTE